jgi:hypothetical protein
MAEMAKGEGSDEFKKMIEQLGDLGKFDNDKSKDETGDIESFLSSMAKELMTKEVLGEPMRDLSKKVRILTF